MSDMAAEKVWDEIAASGIESPKSAFMAGRTSRDVEVAELRRLGDRWQEVISAPGFTEAVEARARHYHDNECSYQREIADWREAADTYKRSRDASDARAESLRAQLAEAQATIENVREYIVAIQNSPGIGVGHHNRWLREAVALLSAPSSTGGNDHE